MTGVPFYLKLASYCRRAGVDFRVITLESPAVVRNILAPDAIGTHLEIVQISKFDFSGTPAIVLVDEHNRVVASWLGWLPSSVEENVLQRVNALAHR